MSIWNSSSHTLAIIFVTFFCVGKGRGSAFLKMDGWMDGLYFKPQNLEEVVLSSSAPCSCPSRKYLFAYFKQQRYCRYFGLHIFQAFFADTFSCQHFFHGLIKQICFFKQFMAVLQLHFYMENYLLTLILNGYQQIISIGKANKIISFSCFEYFWKTKNCRKTNIFISWLLIALELKLNEIRGSREVLAACTYIRVR